MRIYARYDSDSKRVSICNLRTNYHVMANSKRIAYEITSFLDVIDLFKAGRKDKWYTLPGVTECIYFNVLTPETNKVFKKFQELFLKYKSWEKEEKKPVAPDYKAEFESHVEGRSALIYLPNQGIIRIAFRKNSKTRNVTNLYHVCVSNEIAKQFLDDSCMGYTNNLVRKYSINKLYDPERFEKWERILTAEFEKQYANFIARNE